MGAGESKKKDNEVLNIFTPEERTNLHKLFVHIVGNQQFLTKPFLEVNFHYFSPNNYAI